MKPSIPMLLSFLLPLTLAATAHAQEPSGAAPRGVSPAAAPAAPADLAAAPSAPVLAAAPLTYALPAPPPPLLERRSEGLRVAGLVLIPLGSVVLAGGLFVTTLSAFGGATPVDSGDGFSAPASSESGPSSTAVVGLTFMGVGAATLTGGIIMAVVGGKKVPVRTTEALAPAPRWTVEPLLGMGSAGLKGTF